LGIHIKDTIELILGNSLWIDKICEHVDEEGIVLDQAHGFLQGLNNCRLTGIGIADNHEAMSNHDGLIQLDALLEEYRFWLDVILGA